MMLRLVKEEDWGAAAVLGSQWDAKKPLLMPGSAASGLSAARHELAQLRTLATAAAAAQAQAGRRRSGASPAQGKEAAGKFKGLTASEAAGVIPVNLTLLARSLAVWGWPGDVAHGREADLIAGWFETMKGDAGVSSCPVLSRPRGGLDDDKQGGGGDGDIIDVGEDGREGGVVLAAGGGGGGGAGGYDLEVLYERLIGALENVGKLRLQPSISSCGHPFHRGLGLWRGGGVDVELRTHSSNLYPLLSAGGTVLVGKSAGERVLVKKSDDRNLHAHQCRVQSAKPPPSKGLLRVGCEAAARASPRAVRKTTNAKHSIAKRL